MLFPKSDLEGSNYSLTLKQNERIDVELLLSGWFTFMVDLVYGHFGECLVVRSNVWFDGSIKGDDLYSFCVYLP